MTDTLPVADGYRGIWYFCNGMPEPYKYKYSGGLGTYCAKHIPMAVYSAAANRTFFCYGGRAADANRLVHMVSFFDHATGTVPRPRVLLDKRTGDAHDNPVIQLDEHGHVWVFSSAHGEQRPAYIHRSVEPHSIDRFELVRDRNYSYPQPWWIEGRGFFFFHTLYQRPPGGFPRRRLHWATSRDGRTWTEPTLLAEIAMGHYQVSNRRGGRVATAFNYHPGPAGLDHRTNLYYLQSDDMGASWQTAAGEPVAVPLTRPDNAALAAEFESRGLRVYMKDLSFDARGRPVVLVLTSPGHEPGPQNGPRTWTTVHWTGRRWQVRPVTESDSNYDTGCLHVESRRRWRIIGPSQPGPQPFAPGGEMAMWVSRNKGRTWRLKRQLTHNSEFNHTYARRPVNAHPGFYALWADGHGRQESESRLYFCDREGSVWRLPPKMDGEAAAPQPVG